MKTISEMLDERARERRIEAQRRNAQSMAVLAIIAALMALATACVLLMFLTVLRFVEVAPAISGLTP